MGCGASSDAPEGWPSGIPVDRSEYEDWGQTQSVGHLWIAKPKKPEDVVTIANWAAKMDPKKRGEIRPAGTKWSWSPCVFAQGTANPNERDLMLDMTGYANVYNVDKEKLEVTVAPGITIKALLEELDKFNLTLGSYTGSGAMSIGGCIAVGAKGVLVKSADESKNAPGSVYGSMTNFVLKYTLVVSTDGGKTYAEKEFVRGADPEADLLLAGIGRTLMTRVTLKVMPQYNVRAKCFFDVPASVIFAPGNPEGNPANSYADLVANRCRVSSIWIPFTDVAWTRTWELCAEKPETSRFVDSPYNYPYQDQAQAWQTPVIEAMLGQPHETFLEKMAKAVERPFTDGAPGILSDAAEDIAKASQMIKEDVGLAKAQSRLTVYYDEMQAATLPKLNKAHECEDLWGKSHNTNLFVNADLKIRSMAVSCVCKSSNMQRNINVTWTIMRDMINEHREKGEFPMNGQIEWRAMGLDEGKYVGLEHSSPALTSGSIDKATLERTGWDVMFVIEVVHFPKTKGFEAFAKAFLDACNARPELSGDEGLIRPEWSKPFAPSAGPDGKFWADEKAMADIRAQFPQWKEAVAAMKKYDPAGLYETKFNSWVLGA